MTKIIYIHGGEKFVQKKKINATFEIDCVFREIDISYLNIFSCDFFIWYENILKEDLNLCKEIISTNNINNIETIADVWINDEKVKRKFIDKVSEICSGKKIKLLTSEKENKDKSIKLSNFKTFEGLKRQIYTILIIEEDENYSYFMLADC